MAEYAANSVQLSVVAGAGWTRFLGGNPGRRNLIFSVTAGGNVLFNNNDTGVGGFAMFIVGQEWTTNVMYREWGPVVQGEVYLRSHTQNSTITVTEIYRIRR